MDGRAFLRSAFCALSAVMWATACGDDSAQPSTDAAADGPQDATTPDVKRATPITDAGAMMMPDGGFPAPPTGCYSAADCTDAGANALCCYSMGMNAIACVPEGGQCDYVQCQVCDNECPVGLSCIPSIFGGKIRYCAAGEGGPGSDGSGRCGSPDAGGDAGDGGDSGDGGGAVDSGSAVETGSSEAATDAPADTAEDTAVDAGADTAGDVITGDAHD